MKKIKNEFPKKGLVYVVDDNRLYREVIKMILEKEGYAVRLFDDGIYVLKAMNVHKAIKQNVPNLIISDIEMSVIGGLTLFDEVYKLARGSKPTPFLFMTGTTEKELIAAAEERSEYPVIQKEALLKPLAEIINNVLSETETAS